MKNVFFVTTQTYTHESSDSCVLFDPSRLNYSYSTQPNPQHIILVLASNDIEVVEEVAFHEVDQEVAEHDLLADPVVEGPVAALACLVPAEV